MMNQGGDDLEDDFVIDDLVALDEEDDAQPDGDFFSDAGDENDASGEEDEGKADPHAGANAGASSAAVEKKRKRREKEKEKKAKVRLTF